MTIFRKNPLMTRRCDLPRCEEVIYRDTIDKDEAWAIEGYSITLYFCSKSCAEESKLKSFQRECQKPHCSAEAMDDANICEKCATDV